MAVKRSGSGVAATWLGANDVVSGRAAWGNVVAKHSLKRGYRYLRIPGASLGLATESSKGGGSIWTQFPSEVGCGIWVAQPRNIAAPERAGTRAEA